MEPWLPWLMHLPGSHWEISREFTVLFTNLAGWLSRGSWKKRSSKWGYWTSETHSWFSKMTSRRSTSTLNSWPRHEASSVCSGRWNGACCSSWECEWLSNASYSRNCSSLSAFPYLQPVRIYYCISIRNSIINKLFIYLFYKPKLSNLILNINWFRFSFWTFWQFNCYNLVSSLT